MPVFCSSIGMNCCMSWPYQWVSCSVAFGAFAAVAGFGAAASVGFGAAVGAGVAAVGLGASVDVGGAAGLAASVGVGGAAAALGASVGFGAGMGVGGAAGAHAASAEPAVRAVKLARNVRRDAVRAPRPEWVGTPSFISTVSVRAIMRQT